MCASFLTPWKLLFKLKLGRRESFCNMAGMTCVTVTQRFLKQKLRYVASLFAYTVPSSHIHTWTWSHGTSLRISATTLITTHWESIQFKFCFKHSLKRRPIDETERPLPSSKVTINRKVSRSSNDGRKNNTERNSFHKLTCILVVLPNEQRQQRS